jgi:hypothetical protein
LTEAIEFGIAAGEEFVGIALVADVEEQVVAPGSIGAGADVKNVVEGDGEFDDAEVWRKVPAGLGDLIADGLAHFGGQEGELIDGEFFEISGAGDGGQEK